MNLSILALCMAVLFALGCGSERRAPARSPSVGLPSLPGRVEFDPDAAREASAKAGEAYSGIQLTGPLAGAPAVRRTSEIYAVQQIYRRPGVSLSTVLYGTRRNRSYGGAAMPEIDASTDPAHSAKIEREAQLGLVVKDVTAAAAYVLAVVQQHRGYVAKDERQVDPNASVDLLVRVPASSFDAFLDAIAKAGEIKNQSIRSIDASLEHKDIEVLLANLEAAQARYRELLTHATDPGQVLAIERELERVRTDMERVKGRLAYLRDRVAYATIAIGLHGPAATPDVPEGYQAHFAAGARAVSLIDVREGGTNAYGGAGLSLRFPRGAGDAGRGLALDVDILRACCGTTPARSEWAYDVLAGFDLFSESLENGRRRYWNPYLGVRMGVAQTQRRVDFAAAAVLGVEILKTRVLVIDLQTRLMALVGNEDGPHGAVQPSLGMDLGF
ncbi:MAG: DUF4349 domain-containing protein [Deltaproteobacteria bacterium]|nr:DUF4349 domain-containing protein [Deltaproteobacteria bacterium]